MFTFIAILFTVYTILLVVFAQLWIGQLAIIPLVIAWSGAQTVPFLTIALRVACILIAFYIWIKVFKELKAAKAGATPWCTQNVFWMMLLIGIFSWQLVSYGKVLKEAAKADARYKVHRAQLDREQKQRLIEFNQRAARDCVHIQGLCVTQNPPISERGNTFAESLNNAINLCTDLGMRLPTKEEYASILKPLLDFERKLEPNLSYEEFVELHDYYDKNLKNYGSLFRDNNFLTSSLVDRKAVTYKVKRKEPRQCRQKGYSSVCIQTLEPPVVEYHDLGELADRRKYVEYSVHCVK